MPYGVGMHSGTPVLGRSMGLMRPAKHNRVPPAAAEDSAVAGKPDDATADDLPCGNAKFDNGYILGLLTPKGQRANQHGENTLQRMHIELDNAGGHPVHPHYCTQAPIVVIGAVSPHIVRLLESPKFQPLAGSPILVLQNDRSPERFESPCPGSGRLIPRGIAWDDQGMSSGMQPPPTHAAPAPAPTTAGSVRELQRAAVEEQLPSKCNAAAETKQAGHKRTKSPPSGDKTRPVKHGHALQLQGQVVPGAMGASWPLRTYSMQDLQLDFQDLMQQDQDQTPAEDEEQLKRELFGSQDDDIMPISADVFKQDEKARGADAAVSQSEPGVDDTHSGGGGAFEVNGSAQHGGLQNVSGTAYWAGFTRGRGYAGSTRAGEAWATWQGQLAAAGSAGAVHSHAAAVPVVALDAPVGADAMDELGTAQPIVNSQAAHGGIANMGLVLAVSDSVLVASVEASIAAMIAGSWEGGFAADTAAELAAILAVKLKRARAAGAGTRV